MRRLKSTPLSTKILVYSDVQATEGHERTFFDASLPLQRWRVARFFSQLHELYKQERCAGLWDLGDLTDDRTSLPIPTIDTVSRALTPFKEGLNLKLVGNHEQFLRNTSVHVGRLFDPFFTVVDTFEHLTEVVDGVDVIACAFYERLDELSDKIMAAIRISRAAGRRVIFVGHLMMAGSRMESGVSTDGLPASCLAQVDLALLGHVHAAQSLAEKIFYVGSPFQQDFAEEGQRKRVGVITLETAEIRWVDTADFGLPTYHTIELAQLGELKLDSEDRARVILRSRADALRFMADPRSARVGSLIRLDDQVAVNATGLASQASSNHELLAAYVRLVKPAEHGIELTEAEIVELGTGLIDS